MIGDALQTKTGSIIVSVIFGLGLAALFRQTCKGERCIVIKSPDVADVEKHTYRYNQECYKYSANIVPCPITNGKEKM
jgi:hypothetical protein